MVLRSSIAILYLAAIAVVPAALRAEMQDKQTSPGTQNQQTAPGMQNQQTAPGTQNRQGSAANQPDNRQAAKILSDLHMTNQLEIEMGKLAKEKGSQAVKDYADQLVKDHQEADRKTVELAQSQGVKLDEQEVTEAVKEHRDEYQNRSGAEFNRKFADMMVKDHRKTIEKLQKAQRDLTGTPTGELISQVIPVLQKHERMANELLAKIGKS